MRIILWGINYAPELTGIAPYNTALCEFLAEKGDEVEVVTSFSYYPSWRKRPEDEWQWYRDEQSGGVRVHRCWHYVPRHVSTLRRIVHEGSFVVTSFLRLLVMPRPSLFIVMSPPLLLGAAAWLLSRMKRAPFILHVQDLQPDAAVGLGMLQASPLTRALYFLEAFAYRKAARVSGISRGMLVVFARKMVAPKKIVYFPNGVRLPLPGEVPPPGEFRKRLGLEQDVFLAVYSGNLGMKQGLEVVVQAAGLLRKGGVHLVICGDGARREHLHTMVKEQGLTNVTLIPLQSDLHYREMLVDAGCCLIPQQAGVGAFFFPSKLLRVLAFAKPVVTIADPESELARALQECGFGINVLPGRAKELAAALETLAGQPERRAAMGEAGRRFVSQFAMPEVLSNFRREMLALVAEKEMDA